MVTISGPTGVGKSAIAVELARRSGGEIVNFDSIQIYRGFDIGSAKPSLAVRAEVPHHLYDLIDAETEFNAAVFAATARATLQEIRSRGRLPVLVGGTGFYLRALLYGLPEMPGRDAELRERLRKIAGQRRGPGHLHALLRRIDPESGSRIAMSDRHRVERALEVAIVTGKPISAWKRPDPRKGGRLFPAVRFAVTMPRPILSEVVNRRVGAMYADGLVEETRALLARFPVTCRPFDAIGYREAAAVVAGVMSLDAAMNETRRRTRAYAKRQMTWLRSEPDIHWIERSENPLDAVTEIQELLKGMANAAGRNTR